MKKYPFVRQEGIKDCGVASLLMIIQYYKGDYPIEELKEMTFTDKNGVSAYNLVEAAKSIGFEAKGYKIKLEEIDENNIVLPCIAYTLINNSYRHYMVIYEINFKKKYLLIADPASNIKKISFDEFRKIYEEVIISMYPIKNIQKIEIGDNLKVCITNLLKNNKKLILYIVSFSIILSLLEIISSTQFKLGIENMDNLNIVKTFFIIFLFIQILKNITDFTRNKLLILLNEKLDLSLTIEVFKKILFLPYNYYRNRTTGEIVSRFNDLENIKTMISKIILTVLIDLMLVISTLFILKFINDKLFIICLCIVFMYVIIMKLMRKTIILNLENTKKSKEEVNSYLVESITGFETIKGINHEKQILKKFIERRIHLLLSEKKLSNILNLEMLLKNILYSLGNTILIFSAIIFGNKGILTIGDAILFISLFNYFIEPFKNIIELDNEIKEAKISYKKIKEILIKENKEEKIFTPKYTKIEIKNLNYSYNLYNILKNINLKIYKNDKIMLQGKSGSGKSTLLKILKNYYKVSNNMVYINEIDINDLNSLWFNQISYISQNEILFNDTIYNNIVLDKKVDEQVFLKIVKICRVDKIVSKMPLGYKTLIEENGFNISGGEKERIILARTLLSDFEILLIDEGLSQVDINLERNILKDLIEYLKEKTIIFVSHRNENKDLFNKVIQLKNGVIVWPFMKTTNI